MFKKVLFCFFTFMTFSYANDLLEIEKRRDEQGNFEKIINSKAFDIQKKEYAEETEELKIDVNHISLEGNTIFEKFQINSFLKKYTGKNINIYSLIKDLENKYIEKGYIMTRVGLNLEKSDLSSGNISLFILENRKKF